MTQPRIALPYPTSGDAEYNRQCLRAYVNAVEQSGGLAVSLSLTGLRSDLLKSIAGCDGVLLPGSPADLAPSRYGHAVDPATAASDPAREAVDTALLDDALRGSKPVLGICYGLQSINVWRGGTLVQDLSILPVHHAAGSAVAVAHTALVETNSRLGAMLGGGEAPRDGRFARLPVNSSHHQAIGVPGDDLRVTARCSQDGVVEAIEGDRETCGMDIMAVQWHPERSFAISAASRSLFRWVVDAAARPKA